MARAVRSSELYDRRDRAGDESLDHEHVKYSVYIDSVVARADAQDGVEVLAISVYQGAMQAAHKQQQNRAAVEKVARDLITAGGEPACVLTALTNVFHSESVFTKSIFQVKSELQEFGSVDAFIAALARFQQPESPSSDVGAAE